MLSNNTQQEESNQPISFSCIFPDAIPLEITYTIILNLDFRDRVKLSQTSKTVRDLIHQDETKQFSVMIDKTNQNNMTYSEVIKKLMDSHKSLKESIKKTKLTTFENMLVKHPFILGAIVCGTSAMIVKPSLDNLNSFVTFHLSSSSEPCPDFETLIQNNFILSRYLLSFLSFTITARMANIFSEFFFGASWRSLGKASCYAVTNFITNYVLSSAPPCALINDALNSNILLPSLTGLNLFYDINQKYKASVSKKEENQNNKSKLQTLIEKTHVFCP